LITSSPRPRAFIFSTAPRAGLPQPLRPPALASSNRGQARNAELCCGSVSPSCPRRSPFAPRPSQAHNPDSDRRGSQAVEAASALRAQGIFVPAIRYPDRGPRPGPAAPDRYPPPTTQADLAQLQTALQSLDFRLRLRTLDFALCTPWLNWIIATFGIPSPKCGIGSSANRSSGGGQRRRVAGCAWPRVRSTRTQPSGPTCTGTITPDQRRLRQRCAKSPIVPRWAWPVNRRRYWPRS